MKLLNQIARALIVVAVIGGATAAFGAMIGMTAAVELKGSATGVMVIGSLYLALAALGGAVAIISVIAVANRNSRAERGEKKIHNKAD